MSENKPWVSVSVIVTYKNAPKGYLGLKGETWNIGKRKDGGFADIASKVIAGLAEFYCAVGADPDWLNAELHRLRCGLALCEIKVEAPDARS